MSFIAKLVANCKYCKYYDIEQLISFINTIQSTYSIDSIKTMTSVFYESKRVCKNFSKDNL